MFEGFPAHWSTLKKLIWLYKGVMKAASWVWKTVSGSLLHITDALAGDVSALSVAINPVQSGSGDPAPDNVRPISGWTQAKVTRTGKNLFEMTLADIKAANTDGTWTGDKYIRHTLEFTFEQENGFVTAIIANGTPTGQANLKLRSTTLPLINGTSYKLNGCPSGGSVNSYGLWATQSSITDYGSGATFTADGTTVYNGRIRIVQGTECNDLTFRPMIRLSADDAAFAPYSGMTLTIDLDGTIYGGTLDVLTGVLTARPYYASYNGEALVGPWVSSMDKYVAGATPTTGAQVVDLGGTPTTVQLTPAQLTLLAGENNVWGGAGDITMTYKGE